MSRTDEVQKEIAKRTGFVQDRTCGERQMLVEVALPLAMEHDDLANDRAHALRIGYVGRGPTFESQLQVLRDLMLGGRHSRTTVAAQALVSLPTADRWLQALLTVPGVRKVRVGKVSWFEWRPSPRGLRPPPAPPRREGARGL